MSHEKNSCCGSSDSRSEISEKKNLESYFLQIAKKRYSVRKYAEKPVEDEKIETIIEAGICSPTAANIQPYRIIVIRTNEGIKKLSRGAETYGASSAFIICANTKEAWKRPFDGKITSDIDASIVTDHMMHAATDLGLGSLWMTYFKPDAIRENFNIPLEYEPVNILLVGYSADKEQSPDRHHKTRKSREQIVINETF
ncbi:MAG: nitroreductase family protein [Spirochaetes bacterium]|nr:nitroreductase family protein [Spirochaetota bacterium]